MEIRRATLDDLDAVYDCWATLLVDQVEYGSLLDPENNNEPGRQLLAEAIADGQVLVAETGEAIAGIVTFQVDRGALRLRTQRGVIDTLFVRDWARGEGIGSALLDAAEGVLVERGCSVVTVEALVENDRGRAFYRDNGYKPHRLVFRREVETNTKPGGEE